MGWVDGYFWASFDSWENPSEKQKYFYRDDSIMVLLTDLKVCENCGNIFSKKILSKKVNRCPACNVWKKDV